MGRSTEKKSCFCRLFSCLSCLVLLGLIIGLPLYFLLPEDSRPDFLPDVLKKQPNYTLPEWAQDLPERLHDFIPEIEVFNGEDPFNSANPDDANRWQNDGSGLQLTMVNALDEIWHPYFYEAVQEWDNGTPDSLELTTKMNEQGPDSECTEIKGQQKVCNGDYGETDWKGINKVMLVNGWITSSMARMNDHFFKSNDSDPNKRQYTMCHELGHGFGHPHTDESFWNRDLGNCLDYTVNYEGNKSPDQSNYDFLTGLYGSLDGSVKPGNFPGGSDNNNDATKAGDEGPPQGEQQGEDAAADGGEGGGPQSVLADGGGGRRRFLRQNNNNQNNNEHRELFSEVSNIKRRRELQEQFRNIDHLVNQKGFKERNHPGWRLLHETEFGEAHEIDLGDNYKVQLHLMLP